MESLMAMDFIQIKTIIKYKDNGKIIKCMVYVKQYSKMETNLKVILIKVKLKIWENIFFVMEILYKVNLIKIKLQK